MEELTTFEDHLDRQYGKVGTIERDRFDADSLAFRIGEMLKATRQKVHMTQEELAEKTGTKKSYISRIECGKSDIQISTFFKLVETGLGKTLNISIG